MKQMLKSFLSVALLLAATTAVADSNSNSNNTTGRPFYNQRSQGDDLARRMVGEVHYLTRCDTDCFSGSFSATAEYTRTFRSNQLAKALTFNGQTSMLFGLPGGTPEDINSDNFLITSTGTAFFAPRVENFIFDLNLRLNLDEWLCGLYFEIGLPVNWTRWNAGLTDNVGGQIVKAWTGDITLPEVPDKMNFAKLDGRQTKTSVADLQFILGYNIWCTDCGHFGVNLRVMAPTGTRPSGEFFFEPVVGNGKHTEVGGGITAHYMLWENDCDQSFSIWFEGEAHHLFKAKQRRTLDLVNNKAGSRYLLLKKFNTGFVSSGTFVRGPNVLTQDVNVTVSAAGEAAILFDYQHCGFTFDFGYEVWGRTKEKLTLRGDGIPENTYGIGIGTAAGSDLVTPTSTISTTVLPGVAASASTLLSNKDLDLVGGAFPSALSHKVFGHVSYAWENCDYAPFVGVGGYGEFSGRGNRAFSQWAVWAKGGFAFS